MPPPPRRLKPTGVTAEQLRSRQRGALLGLAIGEAMGLRNDKRNIPGADFPQLNDGPVNEPLGGGWLELRKGQVSWASQMAQVLSDSLRSQRRYELYEVARAYRRWLPDAPDAPDLTINALELIADGFPTDQVGRRAWVMSGRRARDNGSLGRCVPIGVFFHRERETRVIASLEDSSLTHFDPVCQLACATFNGLIAAAINSPDEKLDPQQLLNIAETELTLAAALLGRRESEFVGLITDSVAWLKEDLQLAQEDEPELYGPELHLFRPYPSEVRTTYRLALWELFHSPSIEGALIDVVNRGGHSSINAAITGALMGAIFGDRDFPPDWVEAVIEAPGYSPYHPRNLITLAGLGAHDHEEED